MSLIVVGYAKPLSVDSSSVVTVACSSYCSADRIIFVVAVVAASLSHYFVDREVVAAAYLTYLIADPLAAAAAVMA